MLRFYRCCVLCVCAGYFCKLFLCVLCTQCLSQIAIPHSPIFFSWGDELLYYPTLNYIFFKKKKKKINLAIIPKSISVPLCTIFKYAIISTKTILYCCLPTRGYCYRQICFSSTNPFSIIFHFFYLFPVKTCTCQIFFVYCILNYY